MDTDKALGDYPSGVCQALKILYGGQDFYSRININFARQVSNS
jgi:hypothetical protein